MERLEKEEIDILFSLIEEKTGYTQNDLKHGGQRKKVHIRRIFFVICRELLGLSYYKMGGFVSRDHASAIHNINKHFEEIGIYEDYSKLYRSLYKRFKTLYVHQSEHYVKYANHQIRVLEIEREIINSEINKYRYKIKKRNKQIEQIN